MNYKKYILLSAFLLSFGSTYSFDESKVETFYYVTNLETIGKYVDHTHTTLGYLYEYDDFLNEKIAVEYDAHKLSVLYRLQSINQENIKKQLISLDTSHTNIEIFVKYFEGKHPEYQKSIELIKTTGVLNAQDENGDTLFKSLIKNGSFSDIDFALNRGLNPNITDKNGNKAFYDFIKTGGKFYPSTFIDKLLAGKFDEAGTIDIIKNVMKKGFDINSLDGKNEHILFATLDLKNSNILDLILKHPKLDLNIKNIDAKNALHYAIEQGYDEATLFKLMADTRLDINATDGSWNTVFHLLSSKEKSYFVELFKRSIHINAQNRNGETELSQMILSEPDENKILEKYELLKSYKPVDITLKNTSGNTALFTAILTGKSKVFQTLLSETKNINTTNLAGQNMLITASFASGSLEMIQTILQTGIEKNIQDIDGNTALHFALKNMNYEVIQALIQAGVNVNTLNNAGENLLTHAMLKNDYTLLNMAIGANADVNVIVNTDKNSLFSLLAKDNKTEMIKLILKNKSQKPLFDSEDIHGETPLTYAIKNKNLELVKLFIHAGAEVNYTNASKMTALMKASEMGDAMTVAYLVSLPNINLGTIDTNGKNALTYACQKAEENTLKILLSKNLNRTMTDNDGKTCRDYLETSKSISKEILSLIK